MSTYIKIYYGSKLETLEYQANREAEQSGAQILSASLSFIGSGRSFEEPILTVVFEKKPKKKKSADRGE